MKIWILALGLMLSGCAGENETGKLLPATNHWFPGYIGVSGFAATGLGPAGYDKVQDDTIDNEPVQQFLASVLLQPDDLPTGMTLQLVPKGNLISPATFDLCGLPFETELMRLVRRKVQAVDVDGDPIGIASEAVQYESAEAASAARDELESAVAECAADSANGFEFFEVELQSAKLVNPDFLTVIKWVDTSDAVANSTLQIWQQRGNTLVGIELSEATDTPISADLMEYAVTEAEKIATRLAAANPLDIGEFN